MGRPRLSGARAPPSTRLIRGEGGVLARVEFVALFRETRREDSLPLLVPASTTFPDNIMVCIGGWWVGLLGDAC